MSAAVTSVITTTTVTATAPATPVNTHVLTLKIARAAAADYDRIVTDLSSYVQQLETKKKEVSAISASFDVDKLETIDTLVTFYETVQKTVSAAQELITKMNVAIKQCQKATAPLSVLRADQLKTLDVLEATTAALANAEADAKNLTVKIGALEASIASVAEVKSIVNQLCIDCLRANGQASYKVFGFELPNILNVFNSGTEGISAFKAYREQQKSTTATTVAATAAAPATTAQPLQPNDFSTLSHTQ